MLKYSYFANKSLVTRLLHLYSKKKINEGLADQNYIWRTTTINCSSLAFTYDQINSYGTTYRWYFNDVSIVNVLTHILAEWQIDHKRLAILSWPFVQAQIIA